jgi:protein involved in polysaccharide export with SLBB domain
MQQNPDIFKNLSVNQAKKTAKIAEGSLPTANSPSIPNATDLINQPNSELINKAPHEFEQNLNSISILQRYFSILAGETLPIFGAKEFSKAENQDLLFFNTIGRDYQLGPGDIVNLTLRGLNELDAKINITNDGKLIVQNLLPISVLGQTIEQVENQIRSTLKLDDASASAFLSLATARLITVQVSGNVKSPKTLAVPAYTPLSRVMSYIGGVSDTGSLRNIILRDKDRGTHVVDFYDLLQNPLGSNDPVLKNNSTIFVGNKGATVAASGYVARPGIYELSAGTTDIQIRELLKMTGTSLIPPGAILEILSFNDRGISEANSVDLEENLKEGEVLRISFVETRDLANISVRGAVLENFDFASSTPVLIQDLLKGGAVLNKEALLSFAMIEQKDGKSKAINITDALKNNRIRVSPGSTLNIFSQDDFKKLVKADLNETNDPLVAKISETQVSEIFLDGRRIALAPPSTEKSFNEVIRPFYGLTPQTVLDFALVQSVDSGNTVSKAISIRGLLQEDIAFDFKTGTKIFLFERTFYSQLLKRNAASGGNLLNSLQTEFNVIGEALNAAQVVSIFLDGEAFALLPSEQPQTLENVIGNIASLPVSISNDLAILSFANSQQDPEAINLTLGLQKILVGDMRIDFFTENGLRAITDEIERGRNDTLALNIKANANKVFIDGKMIGAFGQFEKLSDTSFSDILRSDSTIYPIFVILSEYESVSGTWDMKTFTLKQLLNEQLRTGVGARFDLLTKPFVASVLEGTTESEVLISFADENIKTKREINQAQLNKPAEDTVATKNEKLGGLTKLRNEEKRPTNNEQNTNDGFSINLDTSGGPKFMETKKRLPPSLTLEALQNASRFVGGGVERPGSYPAANNVSLIELIQIAGGFTPGADRKNIFVQKYEVRDGKLITSKPRIIDAEVTNLKEIVLNGQFSVNVQTFINDAFSGSINILGEVNRPGEYIFARSETLHDVLERASGFSDAAYPLGAVFERISAKEEERASNIILAEKIEQSVLKLSTSDVEGAGDQINAVLGFATQLKSQEAAGRLSVNVLLRDKSVPIYLEDGDRLLIPKRPSHVSVIGSVSQSVRANYGPGKSFLEYIANAGGYSRIADTSRVYLLLPSGEASPLKNSTIIPPGSVIIVPPKTDKLSILGLTDIVSRVLGNIATSILAINNVN